MSEYIVCETNYTNEEILKEALVDIGIPVGAIEVHQEAQDLIGIGGTRRSQKAHIIIRRSTVGSASNDIGFEKQADGSYKAIVSDYDKRHGFGQKVLSTSHGGSGALDQNYAKRAVLRTIAKNYGHKLKTCETKNGKIHVKVSVR